MRLWDNAAALKRLYRWLYLLVLLCLLAVVGVWAVHSPYFPVRQIQVARTLKYVQTTDVESVSRQYLYGNIFTVDVNQARVALTRLPWVASVQVKRMWPDTVLLDIIEREPVARWNAGQLVDSSGKIFNATTDIRLPLLVGAEGSVYFMTVHLQIFESILRPTGLHIRELHLSNRSAWDVVLDNGINLRLGRENVETRLARFVWAWPQVLRNQAGDIDYVDLRYPDGFALRNKSKAVVQQSADDADMINTDISQNPL